MDLVLGNSQWKPVLAYLDDIWAMAKAFKHHWDSLIEAFMRFCIFKEDTVILPGTPTFLGSIVVSIPVCHAGDRGPIPRGGAKKEKLEWVIGIIAGPMSVMEWDSPLRDNVAEWE